MKKAPCRGHMHAQTHMSCGNRGRSPTVHSTIRSWSLVWSWNRLTGNAISVVRMRCVAGVMPDYATSITKPQTRGSAPHQQDAVLTRRNLLAIAPLFMIQIQPAVQRFDPLFEAPSPIRTASDATMLQPLAAHRL